MIIKVPYRLNWAGAYLDCIDEPVITSIINKYITAETDELPGCNTDDYVWVYSEEMGEAFQTPICPQIRRALTTNWKDYVNGCIAAFSRNNFTLTKGCYIKISNDLPSGIGISSSAAFIVAILKVISEVNNLNLSDSLIAELGYWVEHDYLGIPCGRMDFKAVLHEPGIWKINTDTCDLSQDKLVSKDSYSGILVYRKQHNNANNVKFMYNVARIRGTKFNFNYDKHTAEYISCEESVVNCINYLDYSNIDKSLLACFLDNSDANIRRWLDLPRYHFEYMGVWGSKLLGSGINGAYFLLVDPDKQNELLQTLAVDYTVESIEI